MVVIPVWQFLKSFCLNCSVLAQLNLFIIVIEAEFFKLLMLDYPSNDVKNVYSFVNFSSASVMWSSYIGTLAKGVGKSLSLNLFLHQ